MPDQPRATLRDRSKRRAMQAIQAAAIELVEARGYDAVSVEEIAMLAEVSPRSVYRHFETKEGVFLWDEGDLPLLEEVAARLAIVPPLEAVRLAVHELFDGRFDADRPGMLRRIRLIYSVPALEAAAQRQIDQFRRALASILASSTGSDAGELRIQVVAAAAIGALTVAIQTWAARNGERPFAELVDEGFQVLAGGLQL